MKLPPILCRSLTQSTTRRERFKNHFASFGFSYQLVDAIDGRAVGLTTSFLQNGQQTFISAGYIGNIVSFMMCLQIAKVCGYEEVLIVEDDAVILPEFHKHYVLMRKEMPGDWGVVYLENIGESVFKQFSPRLRVYDYPTHLAGILIHRRAYDTLFNKLNCHETLDHGVSKICQKYIRHFCSWPKLFTQESKPGCVGNPACPSTVQPH